MDEHVGGRQNVGDGVQLFPFVIDPFFADRLPVKAGANERNEEPFYRLFWNEPFALLHGFLDGIYPVG